MKLEEEVKRVKKRAQDVEEIHNEKHSLKAMAVSDLVSLIHVKKEALAAENLEKVDQLNTDYPILRTMDLSDEEFQQAETRLRKHFAAHPLSR